MIPNCLVKVWRWQFLEDDSVGGADPTGTFIYENVRTFLQETPSTLELLQQGLETERIFKANLVPPWYDIRERDEIEISAPLDFYHYGDRFRVVSAQPSSHNRRDPRGYMQLVLTRSEESHAQQ